jgi:hypothetical protein
MCWISLQLLSETFFILKIAERDIIVNVNCPLFLSDLKKTSILWADFPEKSKIKFHENPYNDRRVIPCGLTDITKLTVARPNVLFFSVGLPVANAPDVLQPCGLLY